jgi:hypothetical protein
MSGCGITSETSWATDRVITHYEVGCDWPGYLFCTTTSGLDGSLTITLPPGTTVRTVLLSARDNLLWQGIGLTVSVGNALLTSTPCKFISNTGTTSTYSTTGLSAWLTCDNLVGSKLFVTNSVKGFVTLFEVMAFTQYNVQPFV